MTTQAPHQDIKQNSKLIEVFPPHLRPYAILARLDRPAGVWLLLLPALWSITLTAPTLNAATIKIITLFTLGAIIMRAAGCVINDLWDRNLDKQVERTASRPIASGQISPKRAIIFLIVLLKMGLIILLQLNEFTQWLGLASIPLIATYPLMKRITWWPQIFLGLCFNFSLLMGYSAITGGLTTSALWLYGSAIFWTLAYDTIYAHQDIKDDALIGIKSTARLFGNASPFFVYSFYGLSITMLITAIGTQYTPSIIPAAVYALYLCRTWSHKNQESSLQAFKGNIIFGLLILAGLITTSLY